MVSRKFSLDRSNLEPVDQLVGDAVGRGEARAADEEAVGRLRADLEAEGFECLRTVLGAEGARVAVTAE